MADGWLLIGPVIAVALALRLPPAHVMWLGVAAVTGFFISFSTSASLYGECDPCSSKAETLFWINGILFTLAPSLLVVGFAKAVVRYRPRKTGGSLDVER